MNIGHTILPMWAPSVPPLGLNYIYEVLKKNGHNVFLKDYNVIFHKEYLKQKKENEFDYWDGGFAFDWEMDNLFSERMALIILPFLNKALDEVVAWVELEKLDAIG